MNKFALGFAAVAASAIIGTTGLAAAQSLQQQQGSGYGNNENVTINLNLKNSTHNVINVVINFFR
ncbi:MAG TPA: hypothetical protein VLH84_00425 [Patescibacteria group bacterium]|nr:hypothetical protein [Patescibacteria group bacterium]